MDSFPSFRALDTQYVEQRLNDPRFTCNTGDFGRMIAVTIDLGERRQGVNFWLENPKSEAHARSFDTRAQFLDWFTDNAREKLLDWSTRTAENP